VFTNYRAMKAAGRAQVTSVDGATVLQRQYFDRDGQAEDPREDVITVGYIAQELERLIDELDDLKAMASDFATTEEMTIAELKTAVSQATKGL